jgi:methanogenic corrinoid protein MtbC1
VKELLTPKQVARAIDVSESSVKRWCDRGIIPTQYTAGGHRRIALSDLLAFFRQTKHQVLHPEALGLPSTSGQTARIVDRARDQMTEALLRGDEAGCRQIGIDLFLAEHRTSVICDDVLAAAFRTIGNRWACGDAEVYQERRACEIALRVLGDLRSLLPSPPPRAPLAIGGAVSGDHYSLGTTMAELVLRDAKFSAVSLGNNLPVDTLAAAIRQRRPRLFWLSCSYIADEATFLDGYQSLYDQFGVEVSFVVGGYALTTELRQQMQFAAHCDSMQHLEGFAQSLVGAIEQASAASDPREPISPDD